MTRADSLTGMERHPDEALERALTGNLSASEEHELNQHVIVCGACAALWAIARSARRAREPQPWDDELNRIAVDSVLALVTRPRWPRRFTALAARRWAFVAVGISGLGGLASAAMWHAQRSPNRDVVQPHSETAIPIVTRPPPPRVEAVAEPAPTETPVAPSEVFAPRPNRPDRAQTSAAGLFQKASELSTRGRFDQSLAVFRQLQRLYPGARETRLSHALAGRMLLDRGRPALALAQFDRHLALDGEVSEEALVGRAMALRQLGHISAERQTWQRLLEEHPTTVYSNEARTRISALQDSSRAPASQEYPRVSKTGARDPSEDSR